MGVNWILMVLLFVLLLVGILVFILNKGGILMNLFKSMWCKLFDCDKFIAHEGEVTATKTNVETMLPDIAKLKTDMAAIVPLIVGIAAQFPITADLGTVPQEIEALGQPDMSVWLECVGAAKVDDVVEVDIWAKFTLGAEVGAVGTNIVFDPTHFTLLPGQETRGDDVVDWDMFGINETSPGQLTFGGAKGAARGIIGDKPVHLARFKLQVATTSFVAAVIQLDSYVDSLADCRPLPFVGEVLLNEN